MLLLAYCVVQLLVFYAVLNLAYLVVSLLAYFVERFLRVGQQVRIPKSG